jgi:hypothetical protein
VVHGKTIQLDAEPGLPDGQYVNVTLEPVASMEAPPAESLREVLKNAAGTWADDPEGLDQYLEWSRAQRKVSRPELPE